MSVRGAAIVPLQDDPRQVGVSWRETDAASVLTKAQLRKLIDAGKLPRIEDRFAVWMDPGEATSWRLDIDVEKEAEEPAQRTFAYEAEPEKLNELPVLEQQFVCVYGPEPVDDIELSDVKVLDVTDGDGHAPRIQVSAFGGGPLPVRLTAPTSSEGILRARMKGMMFETSKAFMLPAALNSIRRLKYMYEERPGAEVLVVGHADRAGSAAYNLPLSDERAGTIAAYMRDDVDHWLKFYSHSDPAKKWGVREDQHMMSALRADTGQARTSDEDPPGFYTGAIDGSAWSQDTGQATEDFQRFSNEQRGTELVVDGVLGPNTRRALVANYMDQDDTSLPEGTVLKTHGCGEFHPEVQTADGVSEEENRRTDVFFFSKGISPQPQLSCPAPGCPEYPQWIAQLTESVDLREDMPEVTGADWNLEATPGGEQKELAVTLYDRFAQPCPDTSATVLVDGGRRFGVTDGNGLLKVMVPSESGEVLIRYAPQDCPVLVETRVLLDLPPVTDDAGLSGRLANLGYGSGEDLDWAILRFQQDHGLPETAEADDATRQKLADVHDAGAA